LNWSMIARSWIFGSVWIEVEGVRMHRDAVAEVGAAMRHVDRTYD